MRWSWRLWPPVPWGGPERSRFRPGIAYTSRMIACRHDGTRDHLEALAALECPRCPGQRLAPYGPDDANLRICDCCPRIYQMPDNPRDFLADLDEPQYELVEQPARKQPKYPPTKEPAVTYHPPETPAEVAAEKEAHDRAEASARATHEERLAELRREATWGLSWEERKHPRTRTRALILNCPRCGAEVEFRVDSADVTVAAQTVAGHVHMLRADVDLTGGHTCEVGA